MTLSDLIGLKRLLPEPVTFVIPETRFTLRITFMLVRDVGFALSNGLWCVGYRWSAPLATLPRGWFCAYPVVPRTKLVLAGPRPVVHVPRKEGPRKEGPRKEGPRKEGPRKEGPRKEGPRKEGPRKDVPRGWESV